MYICICVFVCLLVCLCVRAFVRSCVRAFVHSCVRAFARSFILFWFVRSIVRSFLDSAMLVLVCYFVAGFCFKVFTLCHFFPKIIILGQLNCVSEGVGVVH